MSKGNNAPQASSSGQSSLDNLKPLLDEWCRLRLDVKDAEKRIAALDKDLKPAISGRGELRMGNYTMNCVEAAGRKTIDKELLGEFLAKHGKTVEDFEKVGAPSLRVTIKEVKEI